MSEQERAHVESWNSDDTRHQQMESWNADDTRDQQMETPW